MMEQNPAPQSLYTDIAYPILVIRYVWIPRSEERNAETLGSFDDFQGT
jgi:hypothetical protein